MRFPGAIQKADLMTHHHDRDMFVALAIDSSYVHDTGLCT